MATQLLYDARGKTLIVNINLSVDRFSIIRYSISTQKNLCINTIENRFKKLLQIGLLVNNDEFSKYRENIEGNGKRKKFVPLKE